MSGLNEPSSPSPSSFSQDFVRLVESFGLSGIYGLARIRTWPALPDSDHVHLESENADGRTLSVTAMRRAEIPPRAVNTRWKVVADKHSGQHRFVPIAPCVHAVAPEAQNWPSDTETSADRENVSREHAEFAELFMALVIDHGVADRFALTRLHRHFGMSDEEVLVERAVSHDRLHIDVVSRSTLTDEMPMLWQVDSSRALKPIQYEVRGSC